MVPPMKVRPSWLITIVVASIAVFVAAGNIPVTSANNYLCGSPWNHTAIQGIFSSCVAARTPSVILMVISAAVGLVALIMLGIAFSQGSGAQQESGQQSTRGGGAAPPAGWHVDPHDPRLLRWWDGERYTDAAKPRN
ncbi:DUF2510 domain-containing protein [Arthrobacter ramosus]